MCNEIWNRDTAAAGCIHAVGMALIAHVERPAVFREHLPWPPTVRPDVVDNEGNFQEPVAGEVEVQVHLEEEDLLV